MLKYTYANAVSACMVLGEGNFGMFMVNMRCKEINEGGRKFFSDTVNTYLIKLSKAFLQIPPHFSTSCIQLLEWKQSHAERIFLFMVVKTFLPPMPCTCLSICLCLVRQRCQIRGLILYNGIINVL